MAINAEQLNIILSARDKEFTKAMDRSQKRVERFSKQSNKNLTKTSKSFGNLAVMARQVAGPAALGAVGTAMVRTLKNATDMAFEIDNLSRVAGTSAERFQELAYASSSVGIEQSKLSDILKDVNDKFGDYYATGAGPLADFFENIAPKVGLAKDAFQGLSSDQALGLYVKSLEDANVSQAELTFYMEALASDATALTPLLQNNAAGFDKMAESGRNLGLIMDEDIVKKGAKMQRQWTAFMMSMRTTFNTFAIDVISGFDGIFNISEDEQFAELGKQYEQLSKDRENANKNIQKTLGGRSFEDLNLLDRGFIFNYQRQAQNASQAMEVVGFAMDALNRKMGERDRIVDQLNAPLGGDLVTGTGSGTGRTTNTVSEMEKAISAYDSLSASLDPVIAATNKYAEAEKTVNAALANRSISSEQAAATLGLARTEMERSISAASKLSSVFETVESSMESAFMSMVDGTASASDAFKSMATEIIKELYRVLVVQKIVGAITGAFTGGAGATPNPHTRASGGPVSAGQSYVTGEHGRELFVPKVDGRILSGAQTSNAARSGGDNVTVNQTINVSTGVQQTVRTEIKTLMPQIAEAAKGAVVDAKRRGGSYGRSFA